jgi:hypothetical protein
LSVKIFDKGLNGTAEGGHPTEALLIQKATLDLIFRADQQFSKYRGLDYGA